MGGHKRTLLLARRTFTFVLGGVLNKKKLKIRWGAQEDETMRRSNLKKKRKTRWVVWRNNIIYKGPARSKPIGEVRSNKIEEKVE